MIEILESLDMSMGLLLVIKKRNDKIDSPENLTL